MMFDCNFIQTLVRPVAVAVITYGVMTGSAIAAENEMPTTAFPDKWMLRAGAYVVDGSKTEVSLNSDTTAGLGTTIDYQRDLGGDEGDTIPRIDAYYRFNERHRIDFTTFSIDRSGATSLAIDITIEDEVYNIGETVYSDIKYTLYKLGYTYSFYHSPQVELGLSAGLNITDYELKFSNATGDKVDSSGATLPLPVFGLRMGYAITPRWNIRYLSEAFIIDIDDTFSGNIFNSELSTEYRLFKNFAIGAGFASIGVDADVLDDDWRGSITDAYRGYNLFGTLYF